MSEKIIVSTQEELNVIPADFEGYVEVAFGDEENPAVIDRASDIAIFVIKGERHAVVRGNGLVHAYGNSHVKAYDQSKVDAYGKSYVIVFDETVQVQRFDDSIIKYVK